MRPLPSGADKSSAKEGIGAGEARLLPGLEVLRRDLEVEAQKHLLHQERLFEQFFRDYAHFSVGGGGVSKVSDCEPFTKFSSPTVSALGLQDWVRTEEAAVSTGSNPFFHSAQPGVPTVGMDAQPALPHGSQPGAATDGLGSLGLQVQEVGVVLEERSQGAVGHPELQSGAFEQGPRETTGCRPNSPSVAPGEGAMRNYTNYTIAGADLLAPAHNIRFHVMSAVEYFGFTPVNISLPFSSCLPGGSEPVRSGCLPSIERSRIFEFVCIMVIASNALYLLWNTNVEMSHALITGKTAPSSEVATATELVFLSWYVLELFLKIAVHRVYFFINQEAAWNWFDITVVLLAAADVIVAMTQDDPSGASLSYLRALRLLKVSKILRMFRVLRFISELRVLLDCLCGCVSSLFWSLVMMAFMLCLFSLFFVQAATTWLAEENLSLSQDSDVDSDYVGKLERHFGSVQDGMLTLFMATSGGMDWQEAFVIVERTGTFNAAIFVFCICLFAIALWNIITSMFMDRAMRAASKNVECLAFEKRKEDLQDAKDFMRVFSGADTDPSRTISLQEFLAKMADPKFRAYFEVRGLDVKDAEAFYKMLAHIHGTKVMSVADFSVACMRLKGIASSVDQHMNLFELKRLTGMLQRIDLTKLEKRLGQMPDLMEEAKMPMCRPACRNDAATSCSSQQQVRLARPAYPQAESGGEASPLPVSRCNSGALHLSPTSAPPARHTGTNEERPTTKFEL